MEALLAGWQVCCIPASEVEKSFLDDYLVLMIDVVDSGHALKRYLDSWKIIRYSSCRLYRPLAGAFAHHEMTEAEKQLLAGRDGENEEEQEDDNGEAQNGGEEESGDEPDGVV
ncbi:hypothetical protein R1sor_023959 [Riccia sorocarpa]|uniref:Uncharacterized protein n=1 Tax=Riccia sorocarpa TaxID=122646 RepID=A0ABD3GP48_9MARC